MLKTDWSKFFLTKSETAEFAVGLSQISQQIFQAGFSLEQTLTYQFGVEKKDLLMEFFKERGVNWQDSSALNKFLSDLQEEVMKIPTVTLTVAFVPKADTAGMIADWIALNAGTAMILDFQVDRELIGGAMINFKGKFCDGSIKQKFVEVINGANLQ